MCNQDICDGPIVYAIDHADPMYSHSRCANNAALKANATHDKLRAQGATGKVDPVAVALKRAPSLGVRPEAGVIQDSGKHKRDRQIPGLGGGGKYVPT